MGAFNLLSIKGRYHGRCLFFSPHIAEIRSDKSAEDAFRSSLSYLIDAHLTDGQTEQTDTVVEKVERRYQSAHITISTAILLNTWRQQQ